MNFTGIWVFSARNLLLSWVFRSPAGFSLAVKAPPCNSGLPRCCVLKSECTVHGQAADRSTALNTVGTEVEATTTLVTDTARFPACSHDGGEGGGEGTGGSHHPSLSREWGGHTIHYCPRSGGVTPAITVEGVGGGSHHPLLSREWGGVTPSITVQGVGWVTPSTTVQGVCGGGEVTP